MTKAEKIEWYRKQKDFYKDRKPSDMKAPKPSKALSKPLTKNMDSKSISKTDGFTEHINTLDKGKSQGFTENIDKNKSKKITSAKSLALSGKMGDEAQQQAFKKYGITEDIIKKAAKTKPGILKKIGKVVGKATKGIPALGIIGALMTGEDATAGLPILGSVDSLGKGSDDVANAERMTSKEMNLAAKKHRDNSTFTGEGLFGREEKLKKNTEKAENNARNNYLKSDARKNLYIKSAENNAKDKIKKEKQLFEKLKSRMGNGRDK